MIQWSYSQLVLLVENILPDIPLVLRPIGPTIHWFCASLLRRPIGPTNSSLGDAWPIGPKTH